MDLRWLIRFVLFMLTRWKVSSSLECSASESVACREEIQSLQEDKSRYYYASDDSTLAEMCRKQLLAVNCVNSYAEECLSGDDQTYFKTLVLGSDKLLDTLCFEDSPLKYAYLKHSPCIRNITQELDNCSLKYQLAQKQLDALDGPGNLLLKKTCCIYFENIQCSTNVTSEACGADASKVVSDVLILLSGTYLTEKCQPYSKLQPTTCTLLSMGHLCTPQLSAWSFLSIFLLLRLKCMEYL